MFAQKGFSPWRVPLAAAFAPNYEGQAWIHDLGLQMDSLNCSQTNKNFSFWGGLSRNTEFPTLEGGEGSLGRNGESCLDFFFMWIVSCELVLTPSWSNTDLTDKQFIRHASDNERGVVNWNKVILQNINALRRLVSAFHWSRSGGSAEQHCSYPVEADVLM